MNTTLVIMAAGIGSRFGEGIKQLSTVDDRQHIIMDYSIHDAIKAGFNNIIFIIREDIEEDFVEVIGNRIKSVCDSVGVKVGYAFQAIDKVPGAVPPGRTKPWGTGQAVLAAKDYIDGPFAVINADDYYGEKAFRLIHSHLSRGCSDYCMAGFVLQNTVSNNGGVTRGICKVKDGYLTEVVETRNIVKNGDVIESNGAVLDPEAMVSMNMWGFNGDFVGLLEEKFEEFFQSEVPENPMKSEFLIPIVIEELLQEGRVKVKALQTDDVWYGMTYKEDVALVRDAFSNMIAGGQYSAELYAGL